MDAKVILWTGVLLLIAVILTNAARREKLQSWVYVLFFFSGFPALLYQIVWQRSLFLIYGVNIQSVTIVVTAFMLGLGLGSLAGGAVSKHPKIPALAVFGYAELGIGAYGVLSLRIFHWAAEYTAGAPALQTGFLSLLLVIIPTMLMGATLPLLVSHLVRVSGHVGRSVGKLYFVNTLGSAVACFVAAEVTMRMLGQSGSVSLAALINVTIGGSVLFLHGVMRKESASVGVSIETVSLSTTDVRRPVSLPLAMLMAAVAGFIALGYEILWYRLYSFATAGLAASFAIMLGAYLAGIAFGALAIEKLLGGSRWKGRSYLVLIGGFVILANVFGYLVAPLLANTIRWTGIYGALPLIAVAAGLMGATFPLIAEASIPADSNAGARLSYLYLSNILGSACGSFLVGFILTDHLNYQQISVFLAIAGILTGIALLLAPPRSFPKLAYPLAGCVFAMMLVIVAAPALFNKFYEKLFFKSEWSRNSPSFKYTVETKSGVINVLPNDAIFGGGIYDGHFNIDPGPDVNGIERAYALSYLHPNPKQVLMVGLSSGSWAQIIANHPQLEKLTIVEINPGYLQLIPKYPQIKSLLTNPKVEIVIDDGRRWLLRNPDKKFDVMVMNTTYYWRAHASNLLSREFLELVRQHLKPGGVHYYNTTSGSDVFLTGTTAFPYSVRVVNFLAVSDSPFQFDKERWRDTLLQYKIDGRPVFNMENPVYRTRLAQFLGLIDQGDGQKPRLRLTAIESGEKYPQLFRGRNIITDDNMGDEWLSPSEIQH